MKKAVLIILILLGTCTAEAYTETPTPVCGTPDFHDRTVHYANNFQIGELTPLELKKIGKLFENGTFIQDTLGEVRTFWVVDSGYLIQVNAVLRAVADYVYVYVQLEDPVGDDVWYDGSQWLGYVSQADVDGIANEFNNSIYQKSRSVFGDERPTGVDNDSHVTILLLDIDSDQMWGYYGGGYVAGYYWSTNEYATENVSYSNQRKMLYIDTFPLIDTGSGTTFIPNLNHSDSYYLEGVNQSFGTIAHEFQHMIHWYHDPDEETWVDEGSADYAQFANGYGHPVSHVDSFLENPDVDLTQWSSTLEDYGASYLFTLYMAELYGGNQTIKSLVNNTDNGILGINTTLSSEGYAETFNDLFTDWVIANYVDNTGIYGGRYGYRNIDLRVHASKIYSGIHQPFQVDLVLTTVSNWAADYIKFITTMGNNTLNLTFNGSSHTFNARVIKTNQSTTVVQTMSLDSLQDGFLTITDFGEIFDTVVMVPSVHDSDYSSTPSYVYSTKGSDITNITTLTFGSNGSGDGQFVSPEGIAIDPSLRYIYVADTGNSRVQVFNLEGTHIRSFGKFGSQLFEFSEPKGINVKDNGVIYVADRDNDRVKGYLSDGILQSIYGEYGELVWPSDVAFNSLGQFIVSETSTNDRITIFLENGTIVKRIGGPGTEAGRFEDPIALDVDLFDNIYAVDKGNSRVQVFNSSGDFYFNFTGNLSSPEGIAIDAAGRIYVADTGNNQIKIFHPDGTLDLTYGSEGTSAGQFKSPKAIDVDALGRIYVADTGNSRVQIFSISISDKPEVLTLISDINLNKDNIRDLDDVEINVTVRNVGRSNSGNFTVKVYAGNLTNGSLINRSMISVQADSTNIISMRWIVQLNVDRITVQVDTENTTDEIKEFNNVIEKSIVVYPITPNFTVTNFDEPRSIDEDSSGKFYVADKSNDRIKVFWRNGTYNAMIQNTGIFTGPSGLAIDANDRIYVTGDGSDKVKVLNLGGTLVGEFNGLNAPQGIDVGSDGRIYVADTNNHSISVYHSNWVLDFVFGGSGNNDTQLNTPMSIASHNGRIYIADRFNNRVQILNADGTYNMSIGNLTAGNATNQLNEPQAIDVSESGMIYIADTGNNRIQVFNTDGTYNYSFNSNETLNQPKGIAVGENGRVYVSNSGSNVIQAFDISYFTDITPPVISNPQPENETLLEPYTTSVALNTSTDETSICRYSNTSGTSFDSMTVFDSTNSTFHSETLTNLTNNNSYNYYIKCRDSFNNTNAQDYHLQYSVSYPQVVINEFMPNSITEWIELYNKGETKVNLNNWMINHTSTGGAANYTLSGFINKNRWKIFYSNETSIQLNDSGDTLLLLDPGNVLIDNYTYSSTTSEYSIGRATDGNETWTTFNATSATPGGSNSGTSTIEVLMENGWNLFSLPLIL